MRVVYEFEKLSDGNWKVHNNKRNGKRIPSDEYNYNEAELKKYFGVNSSDDSKYWFVAPSADEVTLTLLYPEKDAGYYVCPVDGSVHVHLTWFIFFSGELNVALRSNASNVY